TRPDKLFAGKCSIQCSSLNNCFLISHEVDWDIAQQHFHFIAYDEVFVEFVVVQIFVKHHRYFATQEKSAGCFQFQHKTVRLTRKKYHKCINRHIADAVSVFQSTIDYRLSEVACFDLLRKPSRLLL